MTVDEITAAVARIKDLDRTVVCRPEHETAVRGAINEIGAFGVGVKASRYCPDGQVIILNPAALELPPMEFDFRG